ncbi:ATP-binding protein [Cupriavidus sp. CV2]|uniref:AAA family ATPase n=1 Tax=Cupriavidus ulmosensis TaxID=3065913 RepID=UPI00296B3C66|nr:ATP-binding protein [Cupriavidus sp. CV2]MDW3685415.1 ATP-binding protein [Cupriavidus sp. CV2]
MQPTRPAAATPAVLYMVCGKIGSGKSTLARQLAARPATVLISEDDWLSSLYPGEIREVADYARCAGRLRDAMASHIDALLLAGMSVVLDFPANTPATRSWARAIFEQAAAAHQLHYLDAPHALCKARLRARNASGTHPFETSDAQFDAITRYFVAPSADEGFNVIRHVPSEAGAATT